MITQLALNELVARFQAICGHAYVITDRDELYMYGKDQTGDRHFAFDILVKPASAAEIAGVLMACNEYGMPVTPRGGGSGVTGGALPCNGGVVLSTERLNKIIEINATDAFVIAESGVVTGDLCRAVEEQGMYFPVVPGSSSYCFIGGNVAENAGSPHSARYGTTARYVMNLEVVLPTGEVIWTASNVLKNSTGLNLTQLITGSEGVLGVITKVVYRLLPRPAHTITLSAAFHSLAQACNTVVAIRRSGLLPACVELMCRNAVQLATAYATGLPPANESIEAWLLVELHEDSSLKMEDSLQTMVQLLQQHTQDEVLVAQTHLEREQAWKLRKLVGDALIADTTMFYRDIDMSVPLSALFDFITHAEQACAEAGVRLICFGHAFDGNMHMMLLAEKNANAEKKAAFEKAVCAIYHYGVAVGGAISGEHGIGLLQQQFIPLQFSAPHLALMRGIKKLFDPNGILNPGKVLMNN